MINKWTQHIFYFYSIIQLLDSFDVIDPTYIQRMCSKFDHFHHIQQLLYRHSKQFNFDFTLFSNDLDHVPRSIETGVEISASPVLYIYIFAVNAQSCGYSWLPYMRHLQIYNKSTRSLRNCYSYLFVYRHVP